MPEQPKRPLFAFQRHPGDQPPLIRIDPHTLAYFTVILVLVGLAGWLYLHQASQVATYAHEIRSLEHSKEKLHREMIALRAQVAEAGSLEHILEIAPQAGYSLRKVSENDRILIIEVPIEVAGPETSPEDPTDLAPTKISTAPWPQRLLDQLGTWLYAPAE